MTTCWNPHSHASHPVQNDGMWKTEIVRDPAVIRAYIKSRQSIEEEATLADSLAPTGDIDKDKRAKKRQAALTIAVLFC